MTDRSTLSDVQIDSAALEAKRQNAILRLWSHALAPMRFRYPDPRADVAARVELFDCRAPDRPDLRLPGLHFTVRGLRDAPTGRPMHSVTHSAVFGLQWPGVAVAQRYAVSAWALFMVHETLELTTYRDRAWETGLRHSGPYRLSEHRDIPHIDEYDVWESPSLTEQQVIEAHATGTAHQAMLAWTNTTDLARVGDYVLGLGGTRPLIEAEAERARRELENEMDPWVPGC